MTVVKGGGSFTVHAIVVKDRELVSLEDNGKSFLVGSGILRTRHKRDKASQYSDIRIRAKSPRLNNVQFEYILKDEDGSTQQVARSDFVRFKIKLTNICFLIHANLQNRTCQFITTPYFSIFVLVIFYFP